MSSGTLPLGRTDTVCDIVNIVCLVQCWTLLMFQQPSAFFARARQNRMETST